MTELLKIGRHCLKCDRRWVGVAKRPGSRCPFCGSDDTEITHRG
jgi:anaerobic ribonucleoside-triphosphate reductase